MITMTDEHTIQRCINQNKTFLKPILDEIDQKYHEIIHFHFIL